MRAQCVSLFSLFPSLLISPCLSGLSKRCHYLNFFHSRTTKIELTGWKIVKGDKNTGVWEPNSNTSVCQTLRERPPVECPHWAYIWCRAGWGHTRQRHRCNWYCAAQESNGSIRTRAHTRINPSPEQCASPLLCLSTRHRHTYPR